MGTSTTHEAKKKPYTAEPAYSMISLLVPNHTSSTPITPVAKAAKNEILGLLSADTPKASLQTAWATIMTVDIMTPTASASNVTSVSDFV